MFLISFYMIFLDDIFKQLLGKNVEEQAGSLEAH